MILNVYLIQFSFYYLNCFQFYRNNFIWSYFQSTEELTATEKVVQNLKQLIPFLWPKENIVIRLRIVVCILLVIADRVANVYAPLYCAKIGIYF